MAFLDRDVEADKFRLNWVAADKIEMGQDCELGKKNLP